MTENTAKLYPYQFTTSSIEGIRDIQDRILAQNQEVGWNKDPLQIGEAIALCHSELSEALEGVRKDLVDDHLPDRKSVEVELADCMIRILHLSGRLDLDVAGAMAEKHNYNYYRADHKKENREKDGGKKF